MTCKTLALSDRRMDRGIVEILVAHIAKLRDFRGKEALIIT
jgi:hypothetical protein